MPKTSQMSGVDTKALLPWRWAESMRSCSLFWIPVKLGLIPRSQREWLLIFFTKLSRHLSETKGLETEHFMQMQVIEEEKKLRETFLHAMMQEFPRLGRSWLPRGTQPAPPSDQELKQFAEKKREFRPFDHAPRQAWWFLSRDGEALREHYLGYGGLTAFLLKTEQEEMPPVPVMNEPLIIPKFLRADPRLKLLLEDFAPNKKRHIPAAVRNQPPMKQLFRVFDPDKIHEQTNVLMSPFREQTKEIFGVWLPRDLEYEGILFVLPRLASQDFFAHTDPEIRRWFEVFDVYINESPEDEGIIMACKDDLTSLIASIVEQMRREGYRYWEG